MFPIRKSFIEKNLLNKLTTYGNYTGSRQTIYTEANIIQAVAERKFMKGENKR